MQVLQRFKTALGLMKSSLQVLRHNPGLMVFPVASGVAGIAFLAVFLGVTFGVLAIPFGSGNAVMAIVLVALAGIYFGTTFISAFFTAALVHQTRAVLEGEEPSLREGIRGAWEVKGPLLAWAAIAATVGVILNVIEDSNSAVGRVLSSIFSVAWTLMTFFVVPVIVFEEPSVTGMFKQSASRFKQTWGETPLTLAGVGLVSFVVALPFVVPGYLLATSAGLETVGFGLIAVGVVLGAILSHTFKGIVKTCLYIYATEGRLPEEFGSLDPDSLKKDTSGSASGRAGPTTGGVR